MLDKIVEIVWKYSNSDMAFEIADKLHALRYEIAEQVIEEYKTVNRSLPPANRGAVGHLEEWLNSKKVKP